MGLNLAHFQNSSRSDLLLGQSLGEISPLHNLGPYYGYVSIH